MKKDPFKKTFIITLLILTPFFLMNTILIANGNGSFRLGDTELTGTAGIVANCIALPLSALGIAMVFNWVWLIRKNL
ncbi:MAG: hypothetical protein MK081_07305 [Flavobacteriales bacterium]|nr:hypothetical protein [Flavobacteriales bacterium]